MRKKLAILALFALAASCLLAARGWGGASKAFPHAKHLEAGLECGTCHPAAESENLAKSILPPITTCTTECHESAELEKLGWNAIPARTSGFRSYSHKAHLAQGKQCLDCHGALIHPEDAAQVKARIGHDLCGECHDGVKQSNDCEGCHSSLREGRLTGMLRDPAAFKPVDHHPGFLHDHRFSVRLNGRQCESCHRQEDFCSTCHQGENVEFLVHPRNWIDTHSFEARKNLTACESCHQVGIFCDDCHTQGGVKPVTHLPVETWSNPAGGNESNRHALAARRDIESCASCHTQDEVCVGCHRDDGIRRNQARLNIHPPGFRHELGHGFWHDDPDAPCFRCHDPGTHQSGVGFCGYCHGKKD